MTQKDLQKMKELKQKWLSLKNSNYSALQALIDESAKAAGTIALSEEDKKALFKPYGCMNGWTDSQYAEFQVVNALHEAAKAQDPAQHKLHREQRGRGYVIQECSCGMRYEWDESD